MEAQLNNPNCCISMTSARERGGGRDKQRGEREGERKDTLSPQKIILPIHGRTTSNL